MLSIHKILEFWNIKVILQMGWGIEVWKCENYIFKWCYKLSRLSDPPLTPFKYWLPGQPISTLATRGSLAAALCNEPEYNNPSQAAAASLRIWICKRCKCPAWWLLPRQPSLTNSQQLQRPDKASPELETQYSLPPAVSFIVTVGGGRVIYCFHELRCPPFPWYFQTTVLFYLIFEAFE